MGPPIKNKGMKEHNVVNVEAKTATNISCAPATAALSVFSPRCRRYMAFSPTTTASSTTIPVVIIKANMLSMFKLPPII